MIYYHPPGAIGMRRLDRVLCPWVLRIMIHISGRIMSIRRNKIVSTNGDPVAKTTGFFINR